MKAQGLREIAFILIIATPEKTEFFVIALVSVE